MRIFIGLNLFKCYTGSETYTYFLAKELLRRGHEVDIYAHNGYGAPIVDEKLSIQFWDKGTIGENGKRYDVLNLMHVVPIKHMLRKYPGVPAVATHHGITPGEKVTTPERFKKLICVSEEVQHLAITKNGVPLDKTVVVPNFIDLSVYPHLPPRKVGFNFLWAGRVTEWTKGAMQAAMHITRAVASKVTGARLVILANTPKLVDVPEGCPVVVKACRQITSEYLSEFRVVFGSGRVALEAIATGVPVLVVGKDGTDGLVTSETLSKFMYSNFSGRTCPRLYSEETYRSCAKTIIDLLASLGWQRRVNADYASIRKLFDARLVVERIENIYRSIMS